jgi:hypothetical protein
MLNEFIGNLLPRLAASVLMAVVAITVTRVVVGLFGVITGGGYFETVHAFMPKGALMPILVVGFIASFITARRGGGMLQSGPE